VTAAKPVLVREPFIHADDVVILVAGRFTIIGVGITYRTITMPEPPAPAGALAT
jgi:hypothetical protein